MKTAIFSGMFKELPLRTAMEEAGKIGYDGIEIMIGFGGNHLDVNCPPERAREIGKMAEENKLDICLIYTSLGGPILAGEEQRQKDLNDVCRFLDIGDEMGCKMIKVTAGRLKDSAYKDDEARIVADWLGEACDRAAKHDSRIIAEIHFGQYCETVAMARKIIDLVDRQNFGVIHDAGNLHITGDIYGEDSIEVLGDRIFHVHIKDMVRAAADDEAAHDYLAGRFKRALLNDGDVDHLPLFKGLKKIGYDGYLSCEASGGDDPVAVAQHEMDEMRKLLSQV
ncbi:MAG: sugar phosphate isomerase/epimerase [Planctomycetes bacterium]|nr:sugar phosphate isomerase/epimerase [Planctomycetota bacterium]